MDGTTSPGLSGRGPRVAAVLAGLALVFLAAGLFQLRRFDGLFRETAALQHLLFSRVTPLGDARMLLHQSESDLRVLRHFPPEDRTRVLAATVNELRENRRALEAALGSYADLSADSLSGGSDAGLWAAVHGGGGRVLRLQEEGAAARLRVALARLDSLSARIVAGEQTPVGSIEYAVSEAAEPLAQLVALNRHYAEEAEAHLVEERRRVTRSALWLFGAVAALTCATGLLLGRALARERAAYEAELRETARASAYKTWFIGHVSHEFRTPLSSIIGFTSFLHASDRTLPEGRRMEYLDIILRNARHLLHVINDILNLSKVEAGTLELTLAPLYTTEVVAGIVTALRPMAEERGLRIRFTDESQHLARADAGRLRQVLFNLLENAIKYSPQGTEIEIRVTSDPRRVRIEVADQGPGIAPEVQPRLFKEFSRAQPRGARVAGAGLGLALSKRLVDLMEGEIGVDAAPGEGSVFWVELPAGGELLGPHETEVVAVGPTGRARVETVAVIDDDPDIRAYVFTILRHAGYPVVADDGEPGVGARLLPAAPELVLLDLNLRDRSGFDALAELRASPVLAKVPVVAFTASSGADVAQRVERSGFRALLLKPVEPETLVEKVDSILGSLAAPHPPAAPEPPPGEADYLAPLRAKFRSGLPDRLRALEEARGRTDAEGFAREAHKLKGAAAGYGVRELSAAAAAAEEALRREGGSLDDPAVEALLQHLRGVIGAPA